MVNLKKHFVFSTRSGIVFFIIGTSDTVMHNGRIRWITPQPRMPHHLFASPVVKEVYKSIPAKTKYVFSTTKTNDNTNAIFIDSNIKERVMEIRQQPGKDIWLYDGGKLITTFINLGLVDIFRLAVHPVILGSGKPLFKDIKERVGLKLTGTQTSKSGVILLTYIVNSDRRNK